jgi:PBP1b-binding outer membrane lipoprotein LpoB
MKKTILMLLVAALFLAGCNRQPAEPEVEQWDVFEVVLQGTTTGNPYLDVELSARIQPG